MKMASTPGGNAQAIARASHIDIGERVERIPRSQTASSAERFELPAWEQTCGRSVGTFVDVACLYDRTACNGFSHASSASAGRSRQLPVKVGRSTR